MFAFTSLSIVIISFKVCLMIQLLGNSCLTFIFLFLIWKNLSGSLLLSDFGLNCLWTLRKWCCETTGPINISRRLLEGGYWCCSMQSTHLGSDCMFVLLFCGWWFQYQLSFNAFTVLFGTDLHITQGLSWDLNKDLCCCSGLTASAFLVGAGERGCIIHVLLEDEPRTNISSYTE